MRFPVIKQIDDSTNGLACIEMLLKYYRLKFDRSQIARLYQLIPKSTSEKIVDILRTYSVPAESVSSNYKNINLIKLPLIPSLDQRRLVIIYKVSRHKVWIADSGPGVKYWVKKSDFISKWKDPSSDKHIQSINLSVGPYYHPVSPKIERSIFWRFLYEKYIYPFKSYYILIVLGMAIGLILSLIVPLLTKAVVDIGIANKDITFINLILIAQLMTAFSSSILNLIQSWIFLRMGMNISLVSDFLAKIMRLKVAYFDSSRVGDLLQRIGDHSKVFLF